VFGNREMRKIFGTEMKEGTGEPTNCMIRRFKICILHPIILV
jgi:hypothetical protein